MPHVGGALPRLLAQHQRLRVDQPEGVEHDLPSHRLDRVDDDGDCTGVEGLERLLRADVDSRKPATEARVGVVPADDLKMGGGGEKKGEVERSKKEEEK